MASAVRSVAKKLQEWPSLEDSVREVSEIVCERGIITLVDCVWEMSVRSA